MAGYNLDMHCEMILDEYRENQPVFAKMREVVLENLRRCCKENNIEVASVEARIKKEKSLMGKLDLKGHKYATLDDITDILGSRVIVFYSDDVDKISALVDKIFEVDWANSIDKRKMLDLDEFGYLSLHYICKIPKSLYHDPEMPLVNEYRFEIQMRTVLQHMWATMNHDTGYKSGIEVPKEHLRNLNRLAGMLELADEEFSRIRIEIAEYRRNVQSLVASGDFDEVPLDGDTFRSYLELNPFRQLLSQISAINQAEVYHDNLMRYLDPLRKLGFSTLGDIERLKSEYSEDAFRLALHQFAGTDLDIVAASVALQNLLCVYILKNGYGVADLKAFYLMQGGSEAMAQQRAEKTIDQAKKINII